MDNDEIKSSQKTGESGFMKGLLTGILFCALVALIILFVVKGSSDSKKEKNAYLESTSTDAQVSLDDIEDKMEYLQDLIDQYYYYGDETDMNEVADEVYKAYISGLQDKYSAYYTKEEMEKMVESVSGSYCGIGAVVTENEESEVVIILPYEGAPAAEAGLQPGDVVLSIDGTSLTDMSLDEAVSLVRGKEGTTAIFTIRRDNQEFDVSIERKQVDIPTVSSELLDGNIGYVVISSFDLTTPAQYTEAIEQLLDQGAQGIIFDVRNNGGGALDAVTEMLDYLLPEELIVYMEDKYGNRKNYYAEDGCMDETIPIAVLINENTASASELFAGALQDYERARIFGTKSYGKGVVQNVIPLSDGSGLKLTVSMYFTPLGRNFNHNGIDPDVEVELPQEDTAYDEYGYLKEECDTQLNAAKEYIREELDK